MDKKYIITQSYSIQHLTHLIDYFFNIIYLSDLIHI